MKVGVCGAGSMGGHVVEHLNGFNGVQDIIVYDIKEQPLDEVSRRYKVQTTRHINDVLNDPQVRLVFIATPNATHKVLTLQALEAKKAVMCEKPMATTLSDALQMVKCVEQCGGFLQIGFELRYSKLYTTVKRWIDANLLGRLINTYCYYSISSWRKGEWRVNKGIAGSMFGEKLSHYVDLPRWWIGSQVIDVFARSAPNIIPYYEVRDNYHAIYRFENGAVSHLTCMMGLPTATAAYDPMMKAQHKNELSKLGYVLKYVVVGTKGVVKTDTFGRSIERWEFIEDLDCFTSTLAEKLTWDEQDNQSYYHNTLDQTRDVVRRVARGLPPKTSPRDAYATMKLCFAAEESADRGELVKIEDICEE